MALVIDPLLRVEMPEGLDVKTLEFAATVARVHADAAATGHNGDTRASALKYLGEVLAYAASRIVEVFDAGEKRSE